MGGIVNVVISVAALTGVPLYLPVLWSLFSKYQDHKSILTATILSLSINVILKFIIPLLVDFHLDRTEEMIIGVSFPVLILFFFECYYRIKKNVSASKSVCCPNVQLDDTSTQSDNKFSLKVIGLGVSIIGLLIAVLGCFAGDKMYIVMSTGVVIMLLGITIFLKVYFNKQENDDM